MGKRREVSVAGFTLLELIVALFVIALSVGIVAPIVGRSADTLRGRADVARFSAMLRHARDQAITTRKVHAFVVDPGGHRATIVAAPNEVRQTRTLSANLRIDANPPEALRVSFEPNGVSSGGDFRLTTGQMRYRVSIDQLTGRVRIERQE
ncbi:MAG TPA: GspH/FimT family pseudopilin [Candidatus Acidoferrum sp.]|nr:GspH/FimT family pseudopilin [Candidatus Acidoferrum sp.]